MKTHTPSNAAFTLVEVTLALMVMSIGVIAVFSLFPFGVKQSQSMEQDAKVSLFAQEVMDGLRAKASRLPWSQVTQGNSALILEVAAPDLWDQSGAGNTDQMKVIPDGSTTLHEITYWYSPGGSTKYEDSNLSYRLRILDSVPLLNGGSSYGKRIILDVWGNSLANNDVNSPDYKFMTTIFNHRGD